MKLIKFRIRNYKSIKDSGDCYLDQKITILAGKNEAGKTSILEALEDFNTDKNIRNDAIPIENKENKAEIEITFALEDKDLQEIKKRFEIKIPQDEDIEIKAIKSYPNRYEINFTSLVKSIFPEEENIRKNLLNLINDLKEKFENFPLDEKYVTNQPYYTPDPKALFNKLKIKGDDKEVNHLNKKLEELKKYVLQYNKIKEFKTQFEDFFKNNLPNFILFKSFDDVLPDEILIKEAQRNEIIKDLSSISGLDFSKIQPSVSPDERKMHEEEVNLKFSQEYKQFWTQDHSNLYVWWDSNKIYFRIKEGRELYPLKIRSKGRQWHLAFYIRVTARSREKKDNIILIDEPGLFLHAKAQKDILKELEECSKKKQIIYTTHSPYLIPSNALQRVRLVVKNENEGTKIEKITARADKETLTPILTAIGEDLSVGIKVDKKNSIILEGYSDYLWLSAFKKLFNIQEDLNFIPSVGADSSIHIGCILFGWGLDPIFILDNDKKGRDIKKKLKEKLPVDEERIILIPENKEGSIEDLFSKEDFENYVNSGASNYGKVLLAKQFYQKVENGEIKLSDLSKETKENFGSLFEKLKKVAR